jgi:hypothetical protein
MDIFCHVNGIKIFEEGTKLLMEAFCEVADGSFL